MEIVVALGVFAMIATSGAAVMFDSMNTSRDNRERVRAANLADQEIERTRAAVRVAPAPIVDDLDASYDTPVEGQMFSVVRDVTWLNKDGTTVGGPYDATTGDMLLVEVRVRWPKLEENRPAVINSTVLS